VGDAREAGDESVGEPGSRLPIQVRPRSQERYTPIQASADAIVGDGSGATPRSLPKNAATLERARAKGPPFVSPVPMSSGMSMVR
jgi:hypothetical protein